MNNFSTEELTLIFRALGLAQATFVLLQNKDFFKYRDLFEKTASLIRANNMYMESEEKE